MKILLVIESGGGSGRHFADLAHHLVQQGHSVSAIYSPERLEARYVERLKGAGLEALAPLSMGRSVRLQDLSALVALSRLVRTLGPFDVIHAHSSKAGALLRVAGPSRSAKVYTPHAFRTMDPALSGVGRLIYGGIERALAALCTDAIIAVSDEEAQHAQGLGVPPRKVHVVLNGIDKPLDVDVAARRSEMGLDPSDIAVGFVGRLCAQKDPLRFARAIQVAVQESPSIKGIMFGDGEMKAAVEALGVPEVKIISGKNAQDYLPALDVFALTSLYEGMPYVFVEALWASLPIITTDVGGVHAAVRDGHNGIVLPVHENAREVGLAISQLASDEGRRAAFGRRSRELAETMTAARMARETVAAYQAALRRKRRLVEGLMQPSSVAQAD